MSKNILKKSLTKINIEEQFKLSNISILFRQPYYHINNFAFYFNCTGEKDITYFYFICFFEKKIPPFSAYVSTYIFYKLLILAFKIIM